MTPFVKKQRPEEDEGWALTLADMMMLLLCFFIIIVSISKVDSERYNAISDVFNEAMTGPQVALKAQPKAPHETRMEVDPKRQSLFELQLSLNNALRDYRDTVNTKLTPDAVAITMRGTAFFKSGQAELTDKALQILARIAPPLVQGQFRLEVEGHSDNNPISTAQFPSNWELSAARAATVARYFISKGAVSGKLKVIGLADTRPLVSNIDRNGNDIPANQAKNRRITLLVKPSR